MKRLLIFYLAVCITSCKNEQPVQGHWHVFSADSSFSNSFVMDIIDDTLAIMDQKSINGENRGFVNTSEKSLFFPGDCGMFAFKYQIKADKIYLDGIYENYVGIKTLEKCCVETGGLIPDLNLEVNIPQIKKEKKSLKVIDVLDHKNVENIFIGNLKKSISKELRIQEDKSSFLLQVNDVIISQDELLIWLDQIIDVRDEAYREMITIKIVADKNTPLNLITSVIEKINSKKIKKIVFTFLRQNYQCENYAFEYLDAQVFDLDTFGKFSELTE